MAFPIAAGIGAGIGALGGVLGPVITGLFNSDEAQLDREFQAEQTSNANVFNYNQAKIDREFQEHMRDTAFKSAVNQARELGISPSLLLGDQSNQIGGSRANATTASGSKASLNAVSNPLSSITETINKVLDQQHQRELAEDRQEHARELAEDRQKYQEARDQKYFEHQKELAKIYSTNSTTSKEANKRNYTKKELDNLFTPIDQVEI